MRRAVILLIAVLLTVLLAACQPAVGTLVPLPDATPDALPPATSTPTPGVTPTATLPACTETTGKVVNIDIPTAKLTKPINTNLYLPPCYDPASPDGYPLLIMLHGQAALNDQWLRLGLTASADEMITSGEIQPMIIAMPYEISWRLVPEQSQYANALVEDVIPFIEDNYAACDNPKCRAIGGLSRGGNWAVYIGFQHPDLFNAIGAHSTPLFYSELRRIEDTAGRVSSLGDLPRIYVDVGRKDTEKDKVLEFTALLDRLGIFYDFHEFEGRHDEIYWGAHVKDYLRWYSERLVIPN